MVNADELTGDAITEAMIHGRFYASNGVFLSTCQMGPDRYVVEVNTERTAAELQANPLLRGRFVQGAAEGYRIDFIGPGGAVLQTTEGPAARFAIDDTIAYVRAKVTYTRPRAEGEGMEEYYAWGQPVFTDERAGHGHSHAHE